MQPGQDLYFVGFLSTARTRAQEEGAWPSEEDTQFGIASLNPNLGSNRAAPHPTVLLAQVATLVAPPPPSTHPFLSVQGSDFSVCIFGSDDTPEFQKLAHGQKRFHGSREIKGGSGKKSV